MKKIVLLTGDTKIQREISQWLEELGEEIFIEPFAADEAFRERYHAPPENDRGTPVDARDGGDGALDLDALGEKAQRHLPINLLVVDIEAIESDAVTWAVETRQALETHGYSNVQVPTALIFIGYEESESSIDQLRHSVVNDLLLKPLDKSLFLQKAELHLSDGGSSRASFLFKQRTDLQIEMGKDSLIESVSEHGFAIRNPAPLANGVYARVYSSIFGSGTDSALIGRVYRCERHPSESNSYLCYLTFHGITQGQLLNVRRFIRGDKPQPPRADTPMPYIEMPKKQVIVIDLNGDARDLVRDSLESNFMNVAVRGFPSYTAFLRFCTRVAPVDIGQNWAGSETAGAAPASDAPKVETRKLEPARLTLGNSGEISFVLDLDSGEIRSLEPMPKKGATVLGMSADALLKGTASWLSPFDESDQASIQEFLAYLRAGQSGQLQIQARFGTSEVGLRLRGRIERSGDGGGMLARLSLREMSEADWANANGKGAASELTSIDAVFIDGSLLGDNPQATTDGLIELLKRSNLIESRESLTLVIMGDENSQVRPANFRLRQVQDFLFKPLDRKMTIEKSFLHLKGLLPKAALPDLSFKRAGVIGRVTKEVVMEELSEFGLQIRHETPLRESAYLRFFSPIFLGAIGTGILARCLSSTRDPDTGQFHCFFSFFGVTDAQLKHIRNWIRGDYAQRKERAGG